MKFLTSLFCRPSGFGSAGIRRHRICGAILVVGGAPWSSAQRGVEADEVAAGINIESFECRYYLAVNEKLPSNAGEPRARAFSDDFSRDITMSGEVIGPVQYSIATACEVANDTDSLGSGAGDIFLDEGTETESRGDWRKMSLKLSSDPQVTQS